MNAGFVKAARYGYSGGQRSALPARRDFYKVWLVEQAGTLVYGGSRLPVDKPALIFLHPLVPYSFEPCTAERSGYWCIFTKDFFPSNALFKPMLHSQLFLADTPQVCELDEGGLEKATFLFQQIVATITSSYLFYRDASRNLIELLIHEGVQYQGGVLKNVQKNAASRLTDQFLDLLESQFPIVSPYEGLKLRMPAAFAAEMAVHVNHLNSVVQQQTSKSTRTLIAERVVAEAKSLLHYSDWSVADIAFCLGFEYPNHFTAFFKKHTGHTPLSLRKIIL